ncbi:MAG: hypothetical protein KDA60_09600 [Planctomycetales bacterium]|nr:hypothetical protein [Planctomycetales bacterium]
MNTLGLYNVALAIAQLPYMILLRLTYHVQHPVLSEWQRRSPDEMRRRFFGVRAAMLWAGLALTLCVYAGSPLFFRVVYHTNYHEAGSFAKLLCVASWGLILAETVTRALMVFGDSRSLAIYNLIRVLTTLAASFVGYRISGVQGFILGVALGILCGHVVLLFHLYCHRLTRPLQDVGMTIVLVTTASMVELAEAWGAHLPRPLLPQDSEMWPDGLKLITYGSLLGPVLAGVLALTSLALAWRQLRLGRSVR